LDSRLLERWWSLLVEEWCNSSGTGTSCYRIGGYEHREHIAPTRLLCYPIITDCGSDEGRKINDPYEATTQERYTNDEMPLLETRMHKEINKQTKSIGHEGYHYVVGCATSFTSGNFSSRIVKTSFHTSACIFCPSEPSMLCWTARL